MKDYMSILIFIENIAHVFANQDDVHLLAECP